MKDIKKNRWVRFACLALMVTTTSVGAIETGEDPGHSIAKAVIPVEPPVESVQREPRFAELPDRLSFILDKLSAEAPVHYYGFVAKRGQNVLLATPGEKNPERQAWRVEYYQAEQWKTLTFEKAGI